MKIRHLLVLALGVIVLASCHTEKKILYFQDVVPGQEEYINNMADIKLQPKDQISIVVNSKDAELAALFNLVRARQTLGMSSGNVFSNGQGDVTGYTIDDNGYIDFPQVGKVKVAGLNKSQTAQKIKDILVNQNLCSDAVVTVEFMNLYVSIFGEVTKPGKYMITKDRMTILEALSMAGDLTIHGRRDNIYVVREEGGKRVTYTVDIRSKKIFNSPVYYLQQNDAIYVHPSKVRAGQSNINENSFKSVSLWISVASFLVTLANLVFK